MTPVALLDLLRLGAASALVGLGAAALLASALGLLRFPDFYTRLHANAAGDALGAVLIVAGLALAAWDARMAAKLALFAALYAASAPVVAHALASAAHGAGLAPLAGAYQAPRPGAP